MIDEWFKRVGSCIPRGFSRYFILELLKTRPYTGKEIIDYASEQTRGVWKPSPGLIYPLLGRLLDEGLIEESKEGKYQITRKGITTAQDVEKLQEAIKKQLDVLFRVGGVGKFIAMDILEKISTMGDLLSSNRENMTQQENQRYKKFLESELKKINETPDKDIKIE